MQNDIIASFNIDEIDLGFWDRKFITGSVVKLYSYDLPRGSTSDITWDLWRDLNQYLYHPALPILLFEKRYENRYEKGRTPTKLMMGNKTRITIDDREKVELIIPFKIEEKNIPIDVIIFNPGDEQKKINKQYLKNKSVVFTQNGQVHGFEGQSFISQQLGFHLLKETMLINVDCTNINTTFRSNLFMSNRTHLKDGKAKSWLIDKIIEMVGGSKELKRLNQERKNRLIRESKDDKELIQKLFSKLPVDNDLINLLKKHGDLPFFRKYGDKLSDLNGNNQLEEKSPEKKRFPSFFKIDLNTNNDGRILKTIPLNGKGIVKFETDVENEYLFRPKEKGELKIEILQTRRTGPKPPDPEPNPIDPVDSITVEREGPSNGTIKFHIKPKVANVGDAVEVRTTLSAPGENFECFFWVKVIDPLKETSKSDKKKNEDYPNMPIPIKVFKERKEDNSKIWDDYN
ncbi:hypothetical protein ACFLTE_08900 [Bacteroidota bacterium]